jgi:Tfp pilus assembly protein PilX
MRKSLRIKNHKGAVSLFVVIFFSLLVTVVVVGFVRLALKDQQAATAQNLSQSAYDSAQAGVEDAKRALVRLNTVCASGNVGLCNAAIANIDSTTCNASVSDIAVVSNGEVKIQQSTGDAASALDQAYTCVTITRNTTDFVGKLTADEAKVIPLVGVAPFNNIKIEWFSTKDLPTNTTAVALDTSFTKLPLSSSYVTNKPPVMRTHLIQVGGTFNADNMNNNKTNASLFLYPVSGVADSGVNFTWDVPQTATKKPYTVRCSNSLATGGYACSITLPLPDPISGNLNNRTALLELKALYNSANYRVTLYNGATAVKFNNVQPEVDSTGRANGLFRRVQSRLELVDAYAYPSSEVETTGNFCKNFSITDQTADYSNSCNP